MKRRSRERGKNKTFEERREQWRQAAIRSAERLAGVLRVEEHRPGVWVVVGSKGVLWWCRTREEAQVELARIEEALRD